MCLFIKKKFLLNDHENLIANLRPVILKFIERTLSGHPHKFVKKICMKHDIQDKDIM